MTAGGDLHGSSVAPVGDGVRQLAGHSGPPRDRERLLALREQGTIGAIVVSAAQGFGRLGTEQGELCETGYSRRLPDG